LVNLFLVWADLRRKGVKMHHPEIKAFNWIDVGGCQCVVMAIYSADSNSGVCKVVFNKAKSTTRDVDWDGQKWFFPERHDFGGYGRDSDPFVSCLKRGRNV
jgi:hypothetical protein